MAHCDLRPFGRYGSTTHRQRSRRDVEDNAVAVTSCLPAGEIVIFAASGKKPCRRTTNHHIVYNPSHRLLVCRYVNLFDYNLLGALASCPVRGSALHVDQQERASRRIPLRGIGDAQRELLVHVLAFQCPYPDFVRCIGSHIRRCHECVDTIHV